MLIATDLDGTLVPSGQVEPSGFTAEILERVDAAGVPLVFVTARPLRWMDGFWPHVGEHGLAVVSNGAVIFDVHARRPIAVNGIDPVAGLEVVAAVADAVPGATFAIECLDGIRIGAGFVENYVAPDDAPRGPIADIWDVPAMKLLVRHEEMDHDEFRERTIAAVGSAATASWSVADLIEISAAGVTKASALVDLCDRLGVEAADVVAFGDMPNDIPMLRWAGWGVAMANAHVETLEAADEVTATNDEDGVAIVVERLLGARTR